MIDCDDFDCRQSNTCAGRLRFVTMVWMMLVMVSMVPTMIVLLSDTACLADPTSLESICDDGTDNDGDGLTNDLTKMLWRCTCVQENCFDQMPTTMVTVTLGVMMQPVRVNQCVIQTSKVSGLTILVQHFSSGDVLDVTVT